MKGNTVRNTADDIVGKAVGTLRLCQHDLGLCKELAPCLGEGKAMRMLARKELETKLRFQLRDRGGDGRGGDVHLRSGLRDRSFLANGDEVFELAQGKA